MVLGLFILGLETSIYILTAQIQSVACELVTGKERVKVAKLTTLANTVQLLNLTYFAHGV